MFVDKFANRRNMQPQLEPMTFYGQLQHIYTVSFPNPCQVLQLDAPTTIIMAAIRACKIDNSVSVPNLDFHFYKDVGHMHVTDITSIQALIGRVQDGDVWATVDRTGTLIGTTYLDNLEIEDVNEEG